MTTRDRTALTSHGTHADAFSLLDWTMLGGIALIWGSSFVFMAIGLDAFVGTSVQKRGTHEPVDKGPHGCIISRPS